MIGYRQALITIGACVFLTSHLYANSFNLIHDFGTSAESSAIGHIQGFNKGANTIFENPASLYKISNKSISLFNTSVMNMVTYTSLAYAQKLDDIHVGIGLYQASVNNIPETKEFLTTSYFDYKSTITKVAIQKQFNPYLSISVNTAIYQMKMQNYSSKGANFDFGIIQFINQHELSIIARNIIPLQKVTYTNSSDDQYNATEHIPLQFIISNKSPTPYNIDILTQLKYSRQHLLPSYGLIYYPKWGPYIEFRAGYKNELSLALTLHKRYTIGLVMDLFGLILAYSYEQNDYLPKPSTNLFSISYNF